MEIVPVAIVIGPRCGGSGRCWFWWVRDAVDPLASRDPPHVPPGVPETECGPVPPSMGATRVGRVPPRTAATRRRTRRIRPPNLLIQPRELQNNLRHARVIFFRGARGHPCVDLLLRDREDGAGNLIFTQR